MSTAEHGTGTTAATTATAAFTATAGSPRGPVEPGTAPALSVLDLAQIPSGSTASAALRDTVALAQTAERSGCSRFWVAEHHNMSAVASAAPEVLIASIAAATGSIRVGAGGIMLPNHSPLKVAEVFRLLEALHPGRIDLGLGRAPGTDGRTALALRRSLGEGRVAEEEFPEQFAQLQAYVDGFPAGHPLATVRAYPDDVALPPVWVLGSSDYGAQAAAALGTGYAYAGHFGQADPVAVLRHYREHFVPAPAGAPGGRSQPHAVLAIGALVAETGARAAELLRCQQLAMVRLRQGRPGLFPSPEEAAAHRWTPLEEHLAAEVAQHVVAGTPDDVAHRLADLAARAGADEIMVTGGVHDPAERRRGLELLAQAWGTPQATPSWRTRIVSGNPESSRPTSSEAAAAMSVTT